MIKKTSKGYQVVSHSGKPLSDPDIPYKQAEDRLREVEFFKRVKEAKGDDKKKKQGQNDPNTIEEMKKRLEFQNKGYKTKTEQEADKMTEGEKKVIEAKFTKKQEVKPQTKQTELPPVKRFENLKSKLNIRHQKALNKVLGKYE